MPQQNTAIKYPITNLNIEVGHIIASFMDNSTRNRFKLVNRRASQFVDRINFNDLSRVCYALFDNEILSRAEMGHLLNWAYKVKLVSGDQCPDLDDSIQASDSHQQPATNQSVQHVNATSLSTQQSDDHKSDYSEVNVVMDLFKRLDRWVNNDQKLDPNLTTDQQQYQYNRAIVDKALGPYPAISRAFSAYLHSSWRNQQNSRARELFPIWLFVLCTLVMTTSFLPPMVAIGTFLKFAESDLRDQCLEFHPNNTDACASTTDLIQDCRTHNYTIENCQNYMTSYPIQQGLIYGSGFDLFYMACIAIVFGYFGLRTVGIQHIKTESAINQGRQHSASIVRCSLFNQDLLKHSTHQQQDQPVEEEPEHYELSLSDGSNSLAYTANNV